MTPKHLLFAVPLVVLAACDDSLTPTFNGGTVDGEEEQTTDDTDEMDFNGESRAGVLPGTENPTDGGNITRREARDDEASEGYITFSGSGFAENIDYDAGSDTFSVDNLAFDGDNEYQRLTTLAGYDVFESDVTVPDEVSGTPVDQLAYRAIYGESTQTGRDGEPLTRFAIIRTGDYVEYGFGGFVYERNGSVRIPNVDTSSAPVSNQATYAGDYAGLRVYGERGGLDYVAGEIEVEVDFEDFNDTGEDVQGDGVKGRIFNRVYTNESGAVIASGLPTVRFVIANDSVDLNGEITSTVFSTRVNSSGDVVEYENGQFYAVLAGDNADELVGIVVLESVPDENDGIEATLETGGFIADRQ